MSYFITFESQPNGVLNELSFAALIPKQPSYLMDWIKNAHTFQFKTEFMDFSGNICVNASTNTCDEHISIQTVLLSATMNLVNCIRRDNYKEFIYVFNLDINKSNANVIELLNPTVKLNRQKSITLRHQTQFVHSTLERPGIHNEFKDLLVGTKPPTYDGIESQQARKIEYEFKPILFKIDLSTTISETTSTRAANSSLIFSSKRELQDKLHLINDPLYLADSSIFELKFTLNPLNNKMIDTRFTQLISSNLPVPDRTKIASPAMTTKLRNSLVFLLNRVDLSIMLKPIEVYFNQAHACFTQIIDTANLSQRECLRTVTSPDQHQTLTNAIILIFLLHNPHERIDITKARHEKCTLCVNCLFSISTPLTLIFKDPESNTIIKLLTTIVAEDYYSHLFSNSISA